MNKLIYNIFLVFVFILRKLPKFMRRGFFKLLASFAYLVASKTNKIIEANLKLVFDDKISKKEIQEIQKYSYLNMLLWVQSLIENLDVTNDELKNSVSIENKKIIDEALLKGKPIIFISAHFGNMEMLSTYINKNILTIHQVARQSNFEEIDEFIVKAREKSGSKIIFRDGAVKKLVKALIKKEAISLIIDQSINSREGTEVEFLGEKAYQTSTSSILARKFEATIIPIAIFNQDDYKYKIKVYDPILPIRTNNEENDIKVLSQLQANAISDIILEDKKQWFWPHKRFKSHYREIYEKNTNN
ncbi:lipid A biosynthesis lauroyl acyltransferase [Arcobacter peruensis]|uniref:lipid A biosynthesis lauroyl acyltransferase n=1 Tax=Arcobacter peruensis TaxID=2320140 RepID=UPI000F082F5C|nr:lipid A biosynthesis lauroyl acyltransferase [Arcobacter peruensis]